MKPSLLIVYNYFYPGYKAGGPIQSLSNLVITLENFYNISVLTSAYDLHSMTSYSGVQLNTWNSVSLPGSSLTIKVWYAGHDFFTIKKIKDLVYKLNPQIIYLNGIFSYRFFILPLRVVRKLKYRPRVIACPRGMLQSGALTGKHQKKKIYLKFLHISGMTGKVSWHATNEEESDDIKKIFR